MVGDGVSTYCMQNSRPRTEVPGPEASPGLVSPPFCVVLSFMLMYHRCIDHSMHRAAYHFIKALGVSSLTTTKQKFRTATHENLNIDGEDGDGWSDTENINDDDEDINTLMDVNASPNDVEAMLATTTVDYDCYGAPDLAIFPLTILSSFDFAISSCHPM
jgi:hypothetical protein